MIKGYNHRINFKKPIINQCQDKLVNLFNIWTDNYWKNIK